MPKKATHKHLYSRRIRQINPGVDVFELEYYCTICGKVKHAPFEDSLVKEKHGYMCLLSRSDFEQEFPNIDVIETSVEGM